MDPKQWMTMFHATLNKLKKHHIMPMIMVGLVGILLLMLGGGEDKESSKQSEAIPQMSAQHTNHSKEIEKMLLQIPGVSKASVFISYEDNGKTEYAYDYKGDISKKEENQIQENTDNQMVIMRKSGEEYPVVVRQIHPTIKGVAIIVQGDETADLKYKVYHAAKSALGIEAYKIEVIVN